MSITATAVQRIIKTQETKSIITSTKSLGGNMQTNKYSKLIDKITEIPSNFEIWIDLAYEQEREVMCGCYEGMSQEAVDKDLFEQIINDRDYVKVEGVEDDE